MQKEKNCYFSFCIKKFEEKTEIHSFQRERGKDMPFRKKPELLAPAGSMESLKAAVQNGCDAVYLGGKLFSARQYAGNFSLEELEEACDYCHLRGVKVYVTVNTVYKDKELPEFIQFIGKLHRMGVDALIMQDAGAAKLVREHYPDFPLHASTQMTSNSLADVNYWYEQGFDKVVLSRELTLPEIRHITEQTGAEVETFVHGALCVCYSGQCIMSSMLGGRSGNRGRCAQTCRLPYTLYCGYDKVAEGHLLSPKDIATVSILPELIEAGIASLKIEGRMKNPEYVAGVTRIYRKYIDMYFEDPEHYEVSLDDMKELTQLFNRGGFTEGYYTSRGGLDMMSVERPKTWGLKVGIVDKYLPQHKKVVIRTREPLVPGDGIEVWTSRGPHVGCQVTKHSKAGEVITLTLEGDIEKNDVVYRTYGKALNDALQKTWEKETRKLPIYGVLKARKGEPLALQLWDNMGSSVYVTGEVVQEASNQPTAVEKLRQQIEKMGATPFALADLDVQADENIYVGISNLNQLRRDAAEALEQAMLKKTKRKNAERGEAPRQAKEPRLLKKKLHVLVSNLEQLDAAVKQKGVERIYVESTMELEEQLENVIEKCHRYDVACYAALPRVDRERPEDESRLQRFLESDLDGFLVRSAGQLGAVKNSGKKITADYNLNVVNREAVLFWQEQGADNVCLSVENNLQEIRAMADSSCEMVVYGYLPLMTTQQCPIGNFAGEKHSGQYCKKRWNQDLYFLRDRKGEKFPLMTDCERCVCSILNGKPLFALKFYDEVLDNAVGSVRLNFTKEGPARVERIVRAYAEMTKDTVHCSAETRALLQQMSEKGSTKGHFFRGVE